MSQTEITPLVFEDGGPNDALEVWYHDASGSTTVQTPTKIDFQEHGVMVERFDTTVRHLYFIPWGQVIRIAQYTP